MCLLHKIFITRFLLINKFEKRTDSYSYLMCSFIFKAKSEGFEIGFEIGNLQLSFFMLIRIRSNFRSKRGSREETFWIYERKSQEFLCLGWTLSSTKASPIKLRKSKFFRLNFPHEIQNLCTEANACSGKLVFLKLLCYFTLISNKLFCYLLYHQKI